MRLKELRKARKYKQTDIAEVLSCSQGVYSRYESGEREPPFDIIKKLADFYGVTIDYLMGGSATSEPIATLPTLSPAQEKAPTNKRAEAKRLLESMTDEQYQAALQYLKFLKKQDE
jgi:transcriptional regulator with XRE-family HTH domain